MQALSRTSLRVAGFTLLELMVVIAIVAIASLGVVAAMPDPARSQLDKEATRLAALLDTARAYSRASGVAVQWHTTATGFEFQGLAPGAAQLMADQSHWLAPGVSTPSAATLVLGPEPIIAPQQLNLRLGTYQLNLVTDGLRPFEVQTP